MIRYLIFFSFILLLFSCGSNTVLKEVKLVPSYPSASGIECFKEKLYVIGDDANQLMVFDKDMEPVDSIPLYNFNEKRIPKSVKPDLEAITITRENKILLIGSGSLVPFRNMAWLIDPVSKQRDSIRIDTFYSNLSATGLREINIEGACTIPGGIILANRGNKNYPKNHLIITSTEFWNKQAHAPISLILAGSSADSNTFNGISGLAYSSKTDRLIMSVSTEDTRNALDDGAIGKSYLWIIKNFSGKRRWKAINPDQVIDLESIDMRFKGQKIESVCVTKETRNFLYIVLAADNDNGSSTLFRLIAEKK